MIWRMRGVPLFLLLLGCVPTDWWPTRNETTELRLSGHVEVREVHLSFAVAELIDEILVDEGDVVEEGDILARLRREPYELAVLEARSALEQQRQRLAALEAGSRPEEIRKAKADVAGAEAEVVDAKRRYQRLVRLLETRAASQQDVDDALAALSLAQARYNAAKATLDLVLAGPREEDIRAARAELRRREAALALAEYRLQQTELRSPGKGIVEERLLEKGDYAAPERPVFVLALSDPVWVRAFLPEPYLGRVQPGMKVSVRSDAYPDKPLTGTVGHISPVAEFTPRTVETPELRTQLVYEIRVWVPNHEGRLRLGQPVDVLVPLHKTGRQAAEGKTDGGEHDGGR